MNKVLLIGIDGGPWSLIRPWIDQDKLPNLKKIFESGTSANLKSVIPALSCSAWVSMYTSQNPGKHGVYDYLKDDGTLINSKSIKHKKIWQILSHYKKRCAIIGIPVTYPVEEINGYMVSSFLTPPDEKIYSYPKSLMDTLNKHGYKIDIKHEKYGFLPDDDDVIAKKEKFFEEINNIIERRFNTLMELMDEDFDFFMFDFVETDILQHLFWGDTERLLKFFQKVDSYIEKLTKKFKTKNEDSYILVVSDHGFSASPKRSFNLRAWLKENGYLKDRRTLIQKAVPAVYKTVTKIPGTKSLFKFEKSKAARESFQRSIHKSSEIYLKQQGILLRKDILKEDYDKTKNKLISELKSIKDPTTNEEIYEMVVDKDSIYPGSKEGAADIIILNKSKYTTTFSFDTEKVYEDIDLKLPGRHSSDIYGIFMLTGKDVKKQALKEVPIYDIMPTILHILDVPPPQDIDGKVNKALFLEKSDLFLKKSESGEIKELDEKQKIDSTLDSIDF